jgi:hypothetical protein
MAGSAGQRDWRPVAIHTDPIPASAWFGPVVGPWQLREMLGFLGATSGAAVLVWPRDRRHLQRLDAVGIPRLLLVAPGRTPPPRGLLQDSVVLPASAAEIHRRLARLCRSAATRRLHAGPPVVDAGGHLRLGRHHVDLPPCVVALSRALASGFDTPISEAVLLAALPPDLRSRPHLAAWVAKLSNLIAVLGLEAVPAGHDRYLMRRSRALLEWSPANRLPLRTVA